MFRFIVNVDLFKRVKAEIQKFKIFLVMGFVLLKSRFFVKRLYIKMFICFEVKSSKVTIIFTVFFFGNTIVQAND